MVPRERRPRVYLSREETKAINTPGQRERIIGVVLAAYFAVVATFIHLHEIGRASDKLWKLGVMLLASLFFVGVSLKFNRIVMGLGALLCVYMPAVEGTKTSALFFLPAIPLYGFMLWLFMFKISGARRKAMAARMESGDYGVDPRSAAARRPDKTKTATTDTTGRALPTASKRYTPPKAKPKGK
jgi:hypothetical protein